MHSIRIIILSTAAMMVMASCIDRDTIAGTGKEVPDVILGAGGDLQSGTIRVQLPVPLRVRVLSAQGRPVRGIVVEFSNLLGRVSFRDTTARTDGDGYASTVVTLGNVADTIKVNASVIGLKGSPVVFTLIARPSFESQAEKVSGDGQSGVVNGTLSLALKVRILDPYNNVVRNAQAVFSTSYGSFISSYALTDSNGIASAVWKIDSLIGPKTATVTFPTIPNISLQFTATGIAQNPVLMTAVSNDSIHAMEGMVLPGGISVKLQDRYGNPTAGRDVSVSILKGNPGVDTTREYRTGSSGTANIPVTLAFGDSVAVLSVFSKQFPVSPVSFHITQYIYSQIDSLRSTGGTVEVFWEKNLNAHFSGYVLERCPNFNFDQSTTTVATISDPAIMSAVDPSPPAGTSPYYRVKYTYSTGFWFYSNIRQITVQP